MGGFDKSNCSNSMFLNLFLKIYIIYAHKKAYWILNCISENTCLYCTMKYMHNQIESVNIKQISKTTI